MILGTALTAFTTADVILYYSERTFNDLMAYKVRNSLDLMNDFVSAQLMAL